MSPFSFNLTEDEPGECKAFHQYLIIIESLQRLVSKSTRRGQRAGLSQTEIHATSPVEPGVFTQCRGRGHRKKGSKNHLSKLKIYEKDPISFHEDSLHVNLETPTPSNPGEVSFKSSLDTLNLLGELRRAEKHLHGTQL